MNVTIYHHPNSGWEIVERYDSQDSISVVADMYTELAINHRVKVLSGGQVVLLLDAQNVPIMIISQRATVEDCIRSAFTV